MLKNDQKGLYLFIVMFTAFGLFMVACSKKESTKEITAHKTEQPLYDTSAATNAPVGKLTTKPTEANAKQITIKELSKQSTPTIVELKKASESTKMAPNSNTFVDKQLLFETLTGWRQAIDGYTIQKEIAAWSAATLYVAGLLAIVGFIFEKQISRSLEIFLVLSISLVSYGFAVFIHSHYSSLYEQVSIRAATTRCISKLVGDANWSPDFTIREKEVYPVFLIKERDELRSQVSHFKRGRFLKILWCLWTGRRGALTTTETQEAATYSILIITTLTTFGYLMRHLIFGFWKRVGMTFRIKYKNLLLLLERK